MILNPPRCRTLWLSVLVWFWGFPAIVVAQSSSSEPSDARRTRSEVFFGVQSWDDLSSLTPAAGGSFNSTGVNLGAAFHWRLRERERSDVLGGVDFAFFPTSSNIPHGRGDVLSRGLYITPSVKLLFDDGNGPRYGLDFGLGFYQVDLAEAESDGFGGWSDWDFWESSVVGGYVGASVDFPRESSNRESGFSMSAKIHFLDLGEVRDEGAANLVRGVLGQNAGSLSGPIIMLQFGYQWY